MRLVLILALLIGTIAGGIYPIAAHATPDVSGGLSNSGNVVTINFNGTIDQENDNTGGTGFFGPNSLVGQPISGTVIFNTSVFQLPVSQAVGPNNVSFENTFYVNPGSSIQFSENIAGHNISWSGVAGDAQSAIYLYQYSLGFPGDTRTQVTAYGFDAPTGLLTNAIGGNVSLLSDGQLFGNYADLSSILDGVSGSTGQTETLFWNASIGNYDYVIFDDFTYTVQVTTPVSDPAVPEPATWAIMLVGLVGMAAFRFHRHA